MFSRTLVKCLMCTAFLCTAINYQGTHGICNCVFSLEGKTYNITSLESKDDTARFTIEHQGYMYSYNPCRSFHFEEPPPFGDCQDDLAMCWWVKDLMYRKIAEQSTVECGFNKQYKMPMLQYTGDGYIQKTTVLLNCNQSKEQPNFEVVDTSGPGEFVFKLTHKCACPNACLVSPSWHSTKKPTTTTVLTPKNKHITKGLTTTDAPGDLDDILVPVVASVAGVLGLIIVPIGIWRLLRREEDKDRRELLNETDGDVRVDESEKNFPGPSEGTEGTLEKVEKVSSGLKKPLCGENKDNFNSTIKPGAEAIN